MCPWASWFYLFDDLAFEHHNYWATVSAVGLSGIYGLPAAHQRATLGFLLAWFSYLCLDSIVGSIMWLWPHSNRFFQLATVEPIHSHFVLSVIMHWSFALELAIWLAALSLFLMRPAQ